METMLLLEDVSYRYKNALKSTIQDINLEFHRGELTCIVGKSGSGKTTLLSLLAGLDVCDNGCIMYQNKDMKSIDRDQYRACELGMIFQNYNLIPNATALENIQLAMRISNLKNQNKESAYALLDRFGIDADKANRVVSKLSGGEQQRVGIARALSHDPNIILADEPSGNLDEESENDLMHILSDLAHKENRCVIIVTHSKNLCSYADQVWGMSKRGKLLYIEQGMSD